MSQALSRGPLVGCELGHYRVVQKLGEGGMGEVFLAHDEHLGHDVALKVLPPETDERSRHLFRREAHALSKLNHPNIVTVLDFDTQDDLDFLVMEYVAGESLEETTRHGDVSEEKIIHIGVQLAEGLAAAHAHGVIHRDLKPGNLRLTTDGRLKILDFGLARSTLKLSQLATTVSFEGPPDCSGTLPYMAAEQLLGQVVDERTDIYAAGAVLYELCAGHPPFEQKPFPTLVNDIIHKTPVPLQRLRPEILPQLQTIIFTCLEKDPEKRYQSAKDLARELRKLDVSALPDPKSVRKTDAAWYGKFLAGVFLILLILVPIEISNRKEFETRTPHVESLAVLPFANLSGDVQQEYLADGMTDSLITDLGQMHSLRRIISRTSVMRYKTEHVPLSEVAQQLKIDAVIEGSVMRSENTVRITARLVSARDDRQLWSHTYETEFRNLLTLQHELALAIVQEIQANVNGPIQSTPRTVEPAAQEAYLKGNYLQFGNAEQRVRSRQYFEQAIKIDPQYAAAYAGLADSYWSDIGMPARETMPMAREYALKAISLDDNLPAAHKALATVNFYGDWNWDAADREYQRALQLNPNDAESHRMYSVFLAAMGRSDEALAQVFAAQGLDPLNTYNNTTAGWDLYCARRYDQALEQCQIAAELAPNSVSSRSCLSYAYLGKEQNRQALEEAKKAWTLSDEESVWATLLGRTYALAGEKNQARIILGQLQRRSVQGYVPPYFIATLYAALGNKKESLSWLDRAYSERDLYLAVISVDPALDDLRSDARFGELERRMGLAK
jgi:eukaryotic-like serine/threonine-protein kinase